MESRILYILTRTPLHVGAGSSIGAVDQPVQRERHTGYPIIPGSSIKGVMRDHYRADGQNDVDRIFGYSAGDKDKDDNQGAAGIISFSEARLLLFPLRSACGSYAMVTCPLALQRYKRDKSLSLDIPPEPNDSECLSGDTVKLKNAGHEGVVLEEYAFKRTGAFPAEWVQELSSLLDDAVLQGAKDRLVYLANGDFAHFAMNACQVYQHVRIDDKTGTAESGGLFNEETVPSESLFYSILNSMPRDDHKALADSALDYLGGSEKLLQFGGNSTSGLGFCTIKLSGKETQNV